MDQYLYSLETHNIIHLLRLLLIKSKLLTNELTVLAYAAGEGLLPAISIKHYFQLLVRRISATCKYMKPKKCGELFSLIIKQLYNECRCTSVREYFQQMFSSPCMNIFQCDTVAVIICHPTILTHLEQSEKHFLFRLQIYCQTYGYGCRLLDYRYQYSNYYNISEATKQVIGYTSFITSFICGNKLMKAEIMIITQFILLAVFLYNTYTIETMLWMNVHFPRFCQHLIRLALSLLLLHPTRRRFDLSIVQILFTITLIVSIAIIEWLFVSHVFPSCY